MTFRIRKILRGQVSWRDEIEFLYSYQSPTLDNERTDRSGTKGELFAASLSGIEFIDHNLNVIPTPDEDLRRAANLGKQSRS
ncbi:hypothetical protein VNO78_36369 [Psophocarpus tetragonolobus]|uniref:Uncharacterized protein n=1 Tax=Psophocarpus tetragonolobus TaxID=3891 RepID=A0AAN9RD82_PSOTE